MSKYTLLLLFVLFGTFSAFSQTVNNIPVRDIDVEYIEIIGTSRPLSSKVTVEIDFGQQDKVLSSKTRTILDENNRKVAFNSMMDALNFMSKNGYEFVQAYALASENSNVQHFLMRKQGQKEKRQKNKRFNLSSIHSNYP